MPASAWVHRRDQLDARGKGDVRVRPRNAYIAGFKRLAERIEHLPLEFRKFVEEQDPEMSEADLARADPKPAANERRHRRAMVRRPVRAAAPDLAAVEL